MSDKKLLIIVGHGLYEPWINILHEGQIKTWLTWPLNENVKVIHFHGTPVGRLGLFWDRMHEKARWKNLWTALLQRSLDRVLAWPFKGYIPRVSESDFLSIEHDSLQVRIPDTYFTQSWQNIAWFDFVINSTDFDFVFSTTTSSLLKPNQLYKLIEGLDSTVPIYGGYKPYSGATFAAGNNRLFSRSAMEVILANRTSLDFGLIEDVAIGKLFSKLGVELLDLPSLHVTSISEVADAEQQGLIKSNFHIRVKSGPPNQRNDVFLMKEIFKIINKAGDYV